MTDPLERLGLAEIVEDFGLSSLPRLLKQGDPESPRLPLIEPGDGRDLERVERAIHDLEATMNPEQRQQLTTIVAGLAAHILDLAAPDVQAREKREIELRASTPRQMQDEAWCFASSRWREDRNIRVGSMVKAVCAELIAQGYRPPGEKRVREWLYWFAPEEAKAPGRPRKA